MTRRTALAALGASTLLTPDAWPQTTVPKELDAKPRTTPTVCVFSQNLAKIPYPDLGGIAQQMGYDGVDLTVKEGGHVSPRVTNVDLVRAFESIRGFGLDVPMVSTDITTANDPTAYAVLYITGHSQIPLYRMGSWPYGAAPNVARRLAEVRNDLVNLAALGRRCEITAMFPNRAGSFVGEALWDVQSILGDIDPQLMGYCFDPSQATAEGGVSGWELALRLALPRLKAVAVQDFRWVKTGDRWAMQMCPLGEGMVDWQAFFRILAQARFTGPVTVHYGYQAQDELNSMTKDLEFVRKQIQQAWTPAKPGS